MATQVPRLTPEQYLQIERNADFRSEYFDGQMFAMAGGTFSHFRLAGNLLKQLFRLPEGRPCVAGSSDLRVRTGSNGLYTYPDVVVICGEARFAEQQKDTLMNPTLIAEVLSDSTESHDRGQVPLQDSSQSIARFRWLIFTRMWRAPDAGTVSGDRRSRRLSERVLRGADVRDGRRFTDARGTD